MREREDRLSESAELLKIRSHVMRFAQRRFHLSKDAAEELFQEAYARASARQSQEGNIQNLEAYLITTIKRLQEMGSRKSDRRAQLEVVANAAMVTTMPGADEAAALDQRLERLEGLLATFHPRTRDIFILARCQDIPLDEIAQAFGISVSAVDKQLKKAMLAIEEMKARDQ